MVVPGSGADGSGGPGGPSPHVCVPCVGPQLDPSHWAASIVVGRLEKAQQAFGSALMGGEHRR